MHTKLPLCLALLLLTQCSKCKKDDPTPAEQLPPATQTGANTFGCLVNGEVYIPAGRVGLGSNYAVLYETTPVGANLSIRTYRITGNNEQTKRSMSLNVGPVTQARTFSLNLPGLEGTAVYRDRTKPAPCDEYFSNVTYLRGNLTLTRLDTQAGVVSGTFEFTIAQPGCDTVRVTQGRFDKRV